MNIFEQLDVLIYIPNSNKGCETCSEKIYTRKHKRKDS